MNETNQNPNQLDPKTIKQYEDHVNRRIIQVSFAIVFVILIIAINKYSDYSSRREFQDLMNLKINNGITLSSGDIKYNGRLTRVIDYSENDTAKRIARFLTEIATDSIHPGDTIQKSQGSRFVTINNKKQIEFISK